MTEKKIALGDVVRIKSGGPRMAVSNVSDSGKSIECVWSYDGQPQRGSFPAATLEVLLSSGIKQGDQKKTEFLAHAMDWANAGPPVALVSPATMSAVDESLVTSNPRADEGYTAADVAAAMEQCGKEASAFLSIEQRPQKVSGDDIEAMVARLTFQYVDRPGGSNVTFCHAFLDGFFVASGLSMCVDSLVFDQKLGRLTSTDNAIQASRDKLWEFEGYVLHCRRKGRFDVKVSAPHVTINGNATFSGDLKLGEDGPLLAEGVAPARDIGFAANALHDGKRVARRAWGPQGEKWLSMTCASRVKAAQFWSKPNADYARTLPYSIADVPASITVKSAPGEISMGWHATPADVLARDWYVVEDETKYANSSFVRRVPLEAR